MGVRQVSVVSGILLAVGASLSAAWAQSAAMEPMHAAVGMGAQPVAVSFPDFLDDRRLPQLEAAWEAYEHPAQNEPASLPVAETEIRTDDAAPARPMRDISMLAARFAMERLASRDDTVVRRRAEELSRRFGADETPGVVSVTASIDERSSQQPSAEAGKSKPTQVATAEPGQAAQGATLAAEESSGDAAGAEAEPAKVAADEKADLGTRYSLAAPLPLNRPPPLPLRRSAPAAYDPPPAQPKKAVARTRPTSASRTARHRNPSIEGTDNSIASYLPTQLFSFGWNSQPD
jgi:hypothetical protein